MLGREQKSAFAFEVDDDRSTRDAIGASDCLKCLGDGSFMP
jgi:hypothetical protein